MEDAIYQSRILVVDDQEPNVLLLEQLLKASGFANVTSTTQSAHALPMCTEHDPDILLLDLQMPAPDGFEIMRTLAAQDAGPERLPILVLTADASPETKRRALSMGASDFVNKPFDLTEVFLRIRNLLNTRYLQRALHRQNLTLEERVRERTRQLEEAQLEIVDRLARAAEYRDDNTGEHAQRVGRMAARIAEKLGLQEDFVEQIRRAAPLHDVGKLSLPDAILLKPGKLTQEEFDEMKEHTLVGSEILGRSRSRLLELSEEISLAHHERWDGSGYPAGLAGEDIPISGRIVAVADVFDALVNDRPYKEAWETSKALAEIRRLSGTHFDPDVVAAFTECSLEDIAPLAAQVKVA